MNISSRAHLALFITILLWSYQAIAAKNAIADLPSMLLLCLRMGIASLAFLPFFLREKPWRKNGFGKLVGASLFSTVNVTCFLWGIQYTSASASQLIYAAMPVLILLSDYFSGKKRHAWYTVAGVGIGLLGVGYIVYLSVIERGTTITGSLRGNLAIILAMCGWVVYILRSKILSRTFSNLAIGSTSVFIGFACSLVLVTIEWYTLHPPVQFTGAALWGGAYMGIIGTFFAYILYQYGIKHTSPVTVSMTSYIQPVTSAALAAFFLGERLTAGYVIGSLLIFGGVFLSSTMELIEKKRKS